MVISVNFGANIEKRLARFAKVVGCTESDLIKEAVLEKLEDLEDLNIAEKRLKEPGKVWTMEEVEQEIGLED